MKAMLDAEDIAPLLNLKVKQVYALASREQLPFETYRFGRRVLFKRIDVEAFTGMPFVEEEMMDA